MKKIFALFLILCFSVSLCGCENIDVDNIYSAIRDKIESNLYVAEEIVEVKYEEFEIREPQFSECFNALNSRQKEIYRRIYSISEEMPEGFVRLGNYYSDCERDTAIAYKAFLSDNAEIFWMPKSYILGTTSSSKNKKLAIAFQYSKEDTQNSYNVSKQSRDELKKELESVCKRVIDTVQKLENEYEKEKYINDYLCDNVEYTEQGEFVSTAYGALVKGTALCEGYARAFKLLCNKAGIECELIVGEAEGEGHMWNRVNIEKKLSYVDVTWNDRSQMRTYTYFNISEEQLLYDHTIAPFFSEMDEKDIKKDAYNFTKKRCTYTGNTYYERNGRILWQDYYKTASEVIEASAQKGENHAEFMFATDKIKSLFEKNPEKFLNDIQSRLSSVIINSYSAERDTLLLFFE